MLNPEEKLLAITDAVPDAEVAKLIANKMVFYAKSEWYRYRINHHVGPPKYLACPVTYDWAAKGFVGIETTNRAHARQWLTDAALAGYKIEEVDVSRRWKFGITESIELARNRARAAQTPRSDDDDIPF